MSEVVEYECDQQSNPFDCPDCLVAYTPKFDEYGIIVHDGGSSSVGINFCPFCGAKLPESKRDAWFERLEELGMTDPSDSEIPKEFETDEWFRRET